MQGLTIGEIIRSNAERMPDRWCVTHRERRYTFGRVAGIAERLAAVLAAKGIDRGHRIIWWGETSIDVVPLHFALSLLGAVFSPADPRLTREALQPMIDLIDPALIISDADHRGDVMLDDLLSANPRSDQPLPDVHENDIHAIFLTSGTTGQPKAVQLSHRADFLRALVDAAPIPDGPFVCTLAQFHKGGWGNPTEAWISGNEVIYVDHGDPDAILRAVDRYRANRIYAIPAVWRRILRTSHAGLDLSSLARADTGTSPTSSQLMEDIATAFPRAKSTIVYGSTESGPSCRLSHEDIRRKPGSVGRAAPNVSLKLEEGQLLIRSPHLADGYFRNSDATAEAFSNGWYRTGELAEKDDEGFWRVIGRVKDIIRTGGETVAPSEIELILQSHPALADAAVAGVPDERWGELVTAFVVPRQGQSVSLAQLREFCGGRLVSFKQPRAILEISAVPRTGPTKQVQRRRLVEMWRAAQNRIGES